MTVKVIKPGDTPTWARAICDSCRAYLEYKPADRHFRPFQSTYYSLDMRDMCYITCPDCGHDIDVDPAKEPESLA